MKNVIARALALTLCAAMVCALPAFAAEEDAAAEVPAYLAPVRVWGKVTRLENGAVLLKNSNENDPYHEIILHLAETAPVVDAVTGLPLDRELRNGETVYAWVGPAMTLSLPPQATAEVVVANIPADFGAPQYYQVARVKPQAKIAIYPPPALTHVDLVTTGGEELTVTDGATLFPYLTKQMVTLGSLTPGSRILVWRGYNGTVTKVMLFAYEYRGYISWEPTGEVSVNDQRLPVAGKVVNGEVLLPIRAVAEAAGYEVNWVPGQGAVVTNGENLVFSVLPGQDVARTSDGEAWLTGTCYFEKGTTYLPADDLIRLLNLFPVY
ncbi:stalk domain-containing protein [Dysosmobacter sp.]|uniref:stalk domain-containing protein n=1 Tax=Dysosmobacter sp. TaxID=2591382 RepID=UPI002A97381D|nr:stalk domain-containing protein [Dysosmobacter sp.]MDY5613523.1 stalk domain-containing protein [Dysosmobacter sp.]